MEIFQPASRCESEVCIEMEHDYIPVNVDDMPYTQSVQLADGEYAFTFYYNEIDDNYYLDVADYDGNLIQANEPILLNQALWRSINNEDLPIETIIPLDESGIATEVNADNLGVTVQLCIDDIGDE